MEKGNTDSGRNRDEEMKNLTHSLLGSIWDDILILKELDFILVSGMFAWICVFNEKL